MQRHKRKRQPVEDIDVIVNGNRFETCDTYMTITTTSKQIESLPYGSHCIATSIVFRLFQSIHRRSGNLFLATIPVYFNHPYIGDIVKYHWDYLIPVVFSSH